MREAWRGQNMKLVRSIAWAASRPMLWSCAITFAVVYLDAQHHRYIGKYAYPVDHVYAYTQLVKPVPGIEMVQSPMTIGILFVLASLFFPRIWVVHCVARAIRVACIYSTSLPNPSRDCVLRRMRCNDLLPSGHVLTIVSMAVGSDNKAFTTVMAVWAILQSHQAIAEKHHYAVDVILAVVLPILIDKWVVQWHWVPRGLQHHYSKGFLAEGIEP